MVFQDTCAIVLWLAVDCNIGTFFSLLTEMGSEKVLDLSQPICMQMSSRIQGKRPAVYLRYDEPNPSGGYIRIYPKGLRCDEFCYQICVELFSVY